MKLSILLLGTLLSEILSKAGLKKMSLKSKTSNKLKLKHTLKKADVWSPTKIKSGDPKDKTGDEWCKSESDGGALEDCVSFWNDITLERFKCDEKSGQKHNNHKVKCKKSADGDQQEAHDALPNTYYMDSCFKYKMGDEAHFDCDRAECPNSKIIRFTYAQIGLSQGNCPNFYTDFQCHQDVMVSLEEKCGGLEECKFKDLIDKKKDLINMTTQEQLAQCGRIKGEGNFKLTAVITCECKKKPGASGTMKKGSV